MTQETCNSHEKLERCGVRLETLRKFLCQRFYSKFTINLHEKSLKGDSFTTPKRHSSNENQKYIKIHVFHEILTKLQKTNWRFFFVGRGSIIFTTKENECHCVRHSYVYFVRIYTC